MSQPALELVDPGSAFLASGDPARFLEDNLPSTEPTAGEDQNHVKAAVLIAGAFVVWRLWVTRRAREEIPGPPVDAEGALGRLWAKHKPIWLRIAEPTIEAVMADAGLTGEELRAVAADYAAGLGSYIHTQAADAVVAGFREQLRRGVNPTLSWLRAIEGYGLDERRLRSWVAQQAVAGGPISDLIAPGALRALDRAMLARADVLGQNEAWHARHVAKSVAWLYAERRGELPTGTRKRWLTADDERVCKICGPLHLQEVWLDQQFVLPTGQRLWAPGVHPNAVFAGSTFVPYGRCEEMVRAWYDGPAISVRAGEHHTTIGPNHPMMTRRGMVRASELRKDDELVYDLRANGPQRISTPKADLEQMPLVEDAFETLRSRGGLPRVATPADDLHGDRVFCQGEVEVVIATDRLLVERDADALQHAREGDFVRPDVQALLATGAGAGDLGFHRVNLAAAGGMGSGSAWSGHYVFLPVESVEQTWYTGMAYDATTESSLYCSDGFVVSNCRCELALVYPSLIVEKAAPGDPYDRDTRGRFAAKETRRRKVTPVRLPVKEREPVDPAVAAMLAAANQSAPADPFAHLTQGTDPFAHLAANPPTSDPFTQASDPFARLAPFATDPFARAKTAPIQATEQQQPTYILIDGRMHEIKNTEDGVVRVDGGHAMFPADDYFHRRDPYHRTDEPPDQVTYRVGDPVDLRWLEHPHGKMGKPFEGHVITDDGGGLMRVLNAAATSYYPTADGGDHVGDLGDFYYRQDALYQDVEADPRAYVNMLDDAEIELFMRDHVGEDYDSHWVGPNQMRADLVQAIVELGDSELAGALANYVLETGQHGDEDLDDDLELIDAEVGRDYVRVPSVFSFPWGFYGNWTPGTSTPEITGAYQVAKIVHHQLQQNDGSERFRAWNEIQLRPIGREDQEH